MIIPKDLNIRLNEEEFYAHRHPSSSMIESLFVSTSEQLENVRNNYDKYKSIRVIYLHEDVLKKFEKIDYFARIANIHSPMGFDDVFEDRAKERKRRAEELLSNKAGVRLKVIGETKLYDLPSVIDEEQGKRLLRV